jgi:hypothetical protein
MCSGVDSWCLAIELAGSDERVARVGLQQEPTFAIATDAVSNPTTRKAASGGVAERFKAPVIETGTREIGRRAAVRELVHRSGCAAAWLAQRCARP